MAEIYAERGSKDVVGDSEVVVVLGRLSFHSVLFPPTPMGGRVSLVSNAASNY